MEALAITIEEPRRVTLRPVVLTEPAPNAVLVEAVHSGISSGTERLLYDGAMPDFPGMGYPLVPGYETVGRVVESGDTRFAAGDAVFVPGARCYKDVRALFGGASKTISADPDRLHKVDRVAPEMVLFALAATAHHAIAKGGAPNLIIGHGVLGALIARLTVALDHPAPVVHETNPRRQEAAHYSVLAPEADETQAYATIVDASGDVEILDRAVGRLAPGGRIVLAGFYKERLSFSFPAAFMREASFIIAAQWQADDMLAVRRLLDAGRLSFDGLVTHTASAADAQSAYATAFNDPQCLKMVLNWESIQ